MSLGGLGIDLDTELSVGEKIRIVLFSDTVRYRARVVYRVGAITVSRC